MTGSQVTQLATNGRSIYTLANLTPGSSSDHADFNIPTSVGGDANVSFNGLCVAHNLYMLDGSKTDDRGAGGTSDVMPSLDAFAEFRMLTSNYSAEYGLSSIRTSGFTPTAPGEFGNLPYNAIRGPGPRQLELVCI